jgi:pectin methylesterase-like acyl-CoA thioesterase
LRDGLINYLPNILTAKNQLLRTLQNNGADPIVEKSINSLIETIDNWVRSRANKEVFESLKDVANDVQQFMKDTSIYNMK